MQTVGYRPVPEEDDAQS